MKKIVLIILVFVMSIFSFAADKKNLLNYLPEKDIYDQKIIYDKDLYMLDVWATWCPPCRLTTPELIKLQQKYVSKNITVIGLSVDSEGPKVVKAFVKDEKINYPVAMAGDSLKYLPPVRGIPTLFLVNKEGKILKQFIGFTDQDTLAEAIESNLKKVK